MFGPDQDEADAIISVAALKYFSKNIKYWKTHKAAKKARHAAPEQLGNLPASLQKIPFKTDKKSIKSLWRVRFVELAENQARSVCAELWASGLGCIPLPSK